MDYYELMHRDIVVAVFLIDEVDNIQVSFNKDAEKHLPISVKNRKTFISWLHNRAIPTTRHGIAKITDDTFSLMLSNLGLSLTDNYWIRKSSDDYTWNDVNFYRNSFQSSTILDDLTNIDLVGKTNFTPSASLKGDLKKKWIQGKDSQFLIKGNYGNTALQSVSEVVATRLYFDLDMIPYAEYKFADLTSNDNRILGCCVKNFTTEDLEFVAAIDIINSESKRNDESYYQMFIRMCKEHGITDVERFMSVMLSVDFLIANTDRHLNNFGILRNPMTLEWICMAPVFDSGNSLFYGKSHNATLPTGNDLLQTEIVSFYKTLIRQMSIVDTSIIDTSKLTKLSDLENILRSDKSLTDIDIEQRLILMQNLRKYFEDIQNGKELWKWTGTESLNAFLRR